MKEGNVDKLKKGIEQLPVKQAPDVWHLIEEKISPLHAAIEALPAKEAPDIWLAIESGLLRKKTAQIGVWMVAASIALFIASVFLFVQSRRNEPEEVISYSTEYLDGFQVALGLQRESEEDKVLDYIHKNCKRLALTCNDPEFKELLETYIELLDARNELIRKIEEANDQPSLMKYLIRLEKNQTKVGKDMLKKLRSS